MALLSLLLFQACGLDSLEDEKPAAGFDEGTDPSLTTDTEPTDTATTTTTWWNPLDDSDGDGISDEVEGRADDRDSDGDGTPDWEDADSDGDGLSDAEEALPFEGAYDPADSDDDGVPDFRDTDSDGDGIPDSEEGAGDLDGDGTGSYRDLDADGDGMADVDEGTDDWDGDGVPNWADARNDGTVEPILFEAITTEFNSPIGIDFHEYTHTVVLSVNYATGAPEALERVESDGTHVVFSGLTGVTDEVKIATVRSGNRAGFAMGELYVGNGVDGQIVRISPDGTTIDNPWVDLPGDSNGLMRGSLYVDRTGVFDDNLLVATTLGQIWEIDAAGSATMIAEIPDVHLEGLVTVPDAPSRYGPLAGMLLAGAEAEGLLYAVERDGTVQSYDIGVDVEDLDIINPYENFFGVNFGTSRLVGASAGFFLPMAGDILVTEELVTSVGLFHLRWDGTDLVATELRASSGSATIGQWEHTTFAMAGIQEVPDP